MGRRLRTKLPQVSQHLTPTWSYLPQFKREDEKFKQNQKNFFFHRHHRARELPDLPDGQRVWITLGVTPVKGTITSSSTAPCSYSVEMDTWSVRRNRFHLNPSPDGQVPAAPGAEPHKIITRSQTGTVITPPARYRDNGT